ncbi:MAG: hypothetical protein QX199_18945 [Methylococcaceae bacterium]
MYELSERELFEAIHYAKSIDEETGAKIIEQFQLEQTPLAQIVFGIFPAFIAKENPEMSYLFMDLCFDVLCVFQNAFGNLPSQNDMDSDWLEKQSALLDTELQALIKGQHMDEKIKSNLQDRFVKRSLEETTQVGLVNFMNLAIDDFASENPSRVPTIKTTQTMISIVIRLFSNLYSYSNKK